LPPPESSDPTDWPEALCAPDNGAAAALLRAHLATRLRVALSDRSDISEAQIEDFAQESVLRVLSQLERFSGRSRFLTWASSVAINVAFTELRRKRWQDVSLDAMVEAGQQLADEPLAREASAGDDEERTHLLGTLQQAIATHLTARQRAAIVGELQGLPFDQIVSLLGTNRNAAYKLLHDARLALRRHLSDAGISQETIRTAFAP
jgi:RNA polymerase sigma-70 factor (ECF subfamily)